MNYSLPSVRSLRTPPQLVVELRAQGIAVCAVNVEHEAHLTRHVAFLPHPAGTADTTTAAVTALAEYCQSQGITTRAVTLLLPRSSIALKTLCVPPCPATERPALVRLAAAGRSTLPIEELAWGFLIADASNDDSQQVAVATLPRRMVDLWQSALQAAGFTLAAVSVTGLAIGQAMVAAGVSQGVVVHVAGDECYVVSLHASLPVALSQATLQGGDAIAVQIAALVRRMPQQHTGEPALAALYVSGDLTEDVAIEINQQLSDTCSRVERMSTADDPRQFATRAWLTQQRENTCLNLLAPVQIIERHRWPSWARWTVAASVVLGMLALGYGYECHVLDNQLVLLQQQQNQLARQIERGTPLAQAVMALEPSVERQVRWETEIQQLVKKLPDARLLTLKQFRGELAEANGEATLRITGVAQDSRSVTEFQQSLVDDPDRAELFPHGMRPVNDVPGYGVQFDLELKSRTSGETTNR